MLKRVAAILGVLTLVSAGAYAQGLETQASPNDWEEINFEFDSSVLVDGFPSLLRLGELLQKHPGYKVKVEGHTDTLGGGDYNVKLGLARASSVRDFLVKYGARPDQISVGTRGKVDPKYPGQKTVFTKTDEARWMNRRVVLTVTDESGRVIGAGGAGDVIRAMDPPKAGGMADCCSEVLKRLDKLDDIARLLKDLADQNAAMRKQIDDLKNNQQVLESKVNQPPPPRPEGPMPTPVKPGDPRFQLLGVNIGATDDGSVTFTGKGRFFGPFGDHYAFQAQGEYIYTKAAKEGQLDFGLVDRINRFQAGLFASFKTVSLQGNASSGTLGQASLTMDYIFKWGKVGVFGTKGFLNNAVINRANGVNQVTGALLNDVIFERYLRVVDQAGLSATVGLWGNNYVEGNIGYLKSVGYGDRVGGTMRFIFPVNTKIAFTVEGGMNETMLSANNNGRAVVGVQFGNAMRPKEFMAANHAIPVDVPRVRYEVLTRKLRIGNEPPVCDAGGDLIGISPGTITLNGGNSYDPEGDAITYQWVQEAGPSVSLSSATSATTTFSAAAAQAYTFRLSIRDALGGTCSSRVHVTTTANAVPQILFFNANPSSIQSGQSSQLNWKVLNADTVTLSSVGNVQASGPQSVSPTTTTTYTLTAKNAFGTDTATATVTVSTPQTSFLFCYATPSNIMAGESATLNYQTVNATSVSISPGVGNAALNGSIAVTPTQTTNYTVTATGPSGTSSCSIPVTVTAGALPRIVQFSASPLSILVGQTSTLVWVVDNATTVNITTLGNVVLAGTGTVKPTATTTYVLTATNASGSVTASATVTVTQLPPPTVSFTATPPNSAAPGSPIKLACVTTGASTVIMDGLQFLPQAATYTVYPAQSTTYTCLATGPGGQTVSQSLTVNVATTSGPGGPPTVVIAGGTSITTAVRTFMIDASASTGTGPLTYSWSAVNGPNGNAQITNGNTPIASIILDSGNGPYYINLTVVDSKGYTATTTVAITFTGDYNTKQP